MRRRDSVWAGAVMIGVGLVWTACGEPAGQADVNDDDAVDAPDTTGATDAPDATSLDVALDATLDELATGEDTSTSGDDTFIDRDVHGDDADVVTPDRCGNGALDEGELCDGELIEGDTTCLGLGFEGGALTCASGCLSVSLAGCTTTSVCGDGLIAGPEVCDGDNVAGDDGGAPLTCEAFGYSAPGRLECAPDCLRWDLGGCPEDIPGWRCPVLFYADGDCDCGCGAEDPDCGELGAAACVYCNDSGSCSRSTTWGCGDIDPDDTGACRAR